MSNQYDLVENNIESIPFQSLVETLNSEKFPEFGCGWCNGTGEIIRWVQKGLNKHVEYLDCPCCN